MFVATISGNLGRDAEVKSPQGRSVTEFPVGVNRKVRGEDQTVWVRCSVWGERGEKLAPYLTKGTKVCVSGRLWVSMSEGERTYLNVDMDVQEVEFAGGRGDATAQQREPVNTALQAYVNQTMQPSNTGFDDEDIPF